MRYTDTESHTRQLWLKQLQHNPPPLTGIICMVGSVLWLADWAARELAR